MAIQIPRLTPIQQSQPVGSGQITAQPRDVLGIQEQQSNAFEKTLSEVEQHYQNEQKIAAESVSSTAAVKYQEKFDQLFEGPNGLKYKKGEAAYTTEYDNAIKELKKHKDEVFSQYEGMSDIAKSAINKKFREMDSKFNSTLTTWQGKTYNDHADGVNESLAEIHKRQAIHDLALYNRNDPKSLKPFEDTLRAIVSNRQKQGKRNYEVSVDENGVATYEPNVLVKIGKDTSDAVYNAISNLAATKGRAKDAEHLLEKYGNYLDEKNRPALKKQIAEAALKSDALSTAYDLIGKAVPRDEALKKLDDLAKKNPELAAEARKAYYDHEVQAERLSNIESDTAFNDLAKYVTAKQKSGDPFISEFQMMSDSYVARTLTKIKDSKKQEAIIQQVVMPKSSSPAAKSRLYDVMLHRPEEFKALDLPTSDLLVGLDKKDRDRAEKVWRDMNTETKAERRMIYKEMDNELFQSLIDAKIIKKNFLGKLSTADEIKLHEAQDKMLEHIVELPAGTNPDERKKWITEFVKKAIKEKQEAPPLPEPKKFENKTVTEPPSHEDKKDALMKTPAKMPESQLDQMKLALEDFKKEYKRVPNLNDPKDAKMYQDYFTEWKKLKGIK